MTSSDDLAPSRQATEVEISQLIEDHLISLTTYLVQHPGRDRALVYYSKALTVAHQPDQVAGIATELLLRLMEQRAERILQLLAPAEKTSPQ